MLKKFAIILFILIGLGSCESMARKGYIRPSLEESKHIKVLVAKMNYQYRMGKKIDLEYHLALDFLKINELEGKYLIVEFQNPEKMERFATKIINIYPNEKRIYINSNKMYGFKNMHSYLVRLSISNDLNGEKIIDSLEQYIRVENLPAGYLNVL